MRRIVAGCVGIGLLFGALESAGAAWGKKKKQAEKPAPASPQPAAVAQPQAQPAGATVIHTFEDEAKMGEFTRLWERRQAIILRMRVLQSYWSDDKALLAQLDTALNEQYQLDTAKHYILDPEKRTLVEQEAPPGAQPVQMQPNVPAQGPEP